MSRLVYLTKRIDAIVDDIETVMIEHEANPVLVIQSLTIALLTFMKILRDNEHHQELYVKLKETLAETFTGLP